MSHSPAIFHTDSTLLEKVESKDETSSSSGDLVLNSSHEEVTLDSETKETSYNDSKELSQISCTISSRKKSQKPDESNNVPIKRKKYDAEEAAQSIITSDAPTPGVREPSTSTTTESSLVDRLEIKADISKGTARAKRYCRLMEIEDEESSGSDESGSDESDSDGAVNVDSSGDEMVNSFRECSTFFEELGSKTYEWPLKGMTRKEMLAKSEGIFCELEDTVSDPDFDIETEFRKVISRTADNVDTGLKHYFLDELHTLWKKIYVARKLNYNIRAKTTFVLDIIYHLRKSKISFSKDDDRVIAYLILPIIKPIVSVVELAFKMVEPRVFLLRKLRALEFLVDNFGEMQVNGKNLKYFLDKPMTYCNYLLNGILYKLPFLKCSEALHFGFI